MTVRGPETRASTSPIPADAEFAGIQFKLGSFTPALPVGQLVDGAITLPEATGGSFWLHGAAWQLPDSENADVFVECLAREGLLVRDPLVEDALAGRFVMGRPGARRRARSNAGSCARRGLRSARSGRPSAPDGRRRCWTKACRSSTWTFEYTFLPEMERDLGAVTGKCKGILLGRATYEMFEPAWSTRTVEEDPGAPFFNDPTKYVVSSTLKNATWRNSKIIGPYDAEAIRRLKNDVDGGLYTSGSRTLVRAMLADGLVDELHLVMYPVTSGEGPRLFRPEDAPIKLSLAKCAPYEHGVIYLNYKTQAA